MNFTSFPEHFTLKELTATNTGLSNIPNEFHKGFIRSIAWILEGVRSHVGKPLYINSCYRSPEVNAKVGGVRASHHTIGSAVDISIRNLNSEERNILERSLLNHNPCEFIKYDTFYHVAFDFSRIAKSNMPRTFENEWPDIFPSAEIISGTENTDL